MFCRYKNSAFKKPESNLLNGFLSSLVFRFKPHRLNAIHAITVTHIWMNRNDSLQTTGHGNIYFHSVIYLKLNFANVVNKFIKMYFSKQTKILHCLFIVNDSWVQFRFYLGEFLNKSFFLNFICRRTCQIKPTRSPKSSMWTRFIATRPCATMTIYWNTFRRRWPHCPVVQLVWLALRASTDSYFISLVQLFYRFYSSLIWVQISKSTT